MYPYTLRFKPCESPISKKKRMPTCLLRRGIRLAAPWGPQLRCCHGLDWAWAGLTWADLT